ncbi:hypothetical protein AB0D15_31310, partial [Streptomyces sp. NPDC048551]
MNDPSTFAVTEHAERDGHHPQPNPDQPVHEPEAPVFTPAPAPTPAAEPTPAWAAPPEPAPAPAPAQPVG